MHCQQYFNVIHESTKTGVEPWSYGIRCHDTVSCAQSLHYIPMTKLDNVMMIVKSFLNDPFPASFLQTVNSKYMFINSCRWYVSNLGPVVSEATALSTVPQPLP